MITLGTAKEMYKLEGYPAELKTDIREILNILDMNYGENREYFKVGRFVGIVGICGDFQKLFSRWHIDFKSEPCEYSLKVGGYIKKLFITNPDFAIVIYAKEELL